MKRRTIETTVEDNGQTYSIKCNEGYFELYEEIRYRGYTDLEQVYGKYSNNKRYEYEEIILRNNDIRKELNANYKNSYISGVKIIGYNKFQFTTGEIIYDNKDIYLVINTVQNVKVICITKNKQKEKKEKETIVRYYYLHLYAINTNNKEGIIETYKQYKIESLMKNYEFILDLLDNNINKLNEEDKEGMMDYIYNIVYMYTVNEKNGNLVNHNRFINIYAMSLLEEIEDSTRNRIKDDVGCIYYY